MPKNKLIAFALFAAGLIDLGVAALVLTGAQSWILIGTGVLAILLGLFFLVRGDAPAR